MHNIIIHTLFITYVLGHGFIAKPIPRHLSTYQDIQSGKIKWDFISGQPGIQDSATTPHGGNKSAGGQTEICGWSYWGKAPKTYEVLQKYRKGQRIAVEFVMTQNHGGLNGLKVKCVDGMDSNAITWQDAESDSSWIELALDESEKTRTTYVAENPNWLYYPGFTCGGNYKSQLQKDNVNGKLYFTDKYAENYINDQGKLMATYKLPNNFPACKHVVGVWTWVTSNSCYPPKSRNKMKEWGCNEFIQDCNPKQEAEVFRNCFDFEITEDATCDSNNTGYGCHPSNNSGQGVFAASSSVDNNSTPVPNNPGTNNPNTKKPINESKKDPSLSDSGTMTEVDNSLSKNNGKLPRSSSIHNNITPSILFILILY